MGRRHLLAALAVAAVFVGCSSRPIGREEWTTMGTIAAVQWRGEKTDGVAQAIDATKRAFATVERLLNAHDETSELRRLQALPDAQILKACDPAVRPCYAAAFRLRDETGGLFNPRWRGAGTMDLGGIAKGFAVDVAAEAVREKGGDADLLIDLGGNLRSVKGCWTTGVADPQCAEDGIAETFALTSGAASATSGEYYRGRHIRDGRTGAEAKATVASVTVVHPTSAMEADGLSTVLFLLGRDKGTAYLSEHAPEARAIWITNRQEKDNNR